MNKIPWSKTGFYAETLKYGGRTKTPGYENPTPETVEDMKELINILHKYPKTKKYRHIKRQLKKLNMGVKRFKEHRSVMLFYPKYKNKVAIGFYWRFGKIKIPGNPTTYNNPVDPFVLEEPHIGVDGTSRVTNKIFAGTKARIWIFNAVHPKSSPLPPVRCQETRNLSDAAHSISTLFHKVHMHVFELYPYAMCLQVHGMGIGKIMHSLLVNCHRGFTTEEKSFPTLFGQTLPDYFNEEWCGTFTFGGKIPGTAFGKKLTDGRKDGVFTSLTNTHTTCVQGRHLNGGSQCHIGKGPSGRFMHMELDYKFKGRSDVARARADLIVKALDKTCQKWVGYNVEEESDHDSEHEYCECEKDGPELKRRKLS